MISALLVVALPDDPSNIVALARRCEDGGADAIQIPPPRPGTWASSFAVLAAVAASTRKVRLAVGAFPPADGSAALLAKVCATVDLLSNGRLDLCLAASTTSTGDVRLHDTVLACKALWKPGAATLVRDTVAFDALWCEPKPSQAAGPPILVEHSVHSIDAERLLEVMDGWIAPSGATPRDLSVAVSVVRHGARRLGAAAGVARIRATAPDLHTAVALADAGATEIVLSPLPFEDPSAWITATTTAWTGLW